MENIINSYETLFITDVSNGEEATQATVEKFVNLITANGEVLGVNKWGKRRLAYPINDMPEGYYVVATYKAEGNFPAEFERLCNIDETVMRSMTIKLEYDAAEKKAAKLAEAPAVEAVAEEAATEEVAAVEATEATDAE